MRSRHGTLLIIGLALVALAGTTAAQDSYLPLAAGNTWTYTAPMGDEVKLVTGQELILGEDLWVIDFVASPENGNLENYWSVDAEGDVYLWGFWRGTWGRAYVPPVKFVDAPLAVGNSWATTVEILRFRSLEYISTHTFAFTVLEEGILSVPAGDFQTFGIGDSTAKSLVHGDEQYTITGEVYRPGSREGRHWWSAGVGEVQYDQWEIFRLSSYDLQTVGAEGRTWSDVKALFD